MRCGSCAHQWFVEREEPPATAPLEAIVINDDTAPASGIESELTAADTIPAATNVPALTVRTLPKWPFMLAFCLSALLWLCLAGFSYYPNLRQAPGLSSIYSMMGNTNTQGLAFADIKMTREELENKTRFIFSGNIVNHAVESRKVPTVRVLLKAKDGSKIWSRDYPVNVVLKPEEAYPFRIVNVETSFGNKVVTILLDLGNGIELEMR